MSYKPFGEARSDIIKKVMEIRRRDEKYKERNEVVDLPNLITREVYQDEELIIEEICTRYINIKKRIEHQTIKRILKNMGLKNPKIKGI